MLKEEIEIYNKVCDCNISVLFSNISEEGIKFH